MNSFNYEQECLNLISSFFNVNAEFDYPHWEGADPITIFCKEGTVEISAGDRKERPQTAEDVFKVLLSFERSDDPEERTVGVYRDLQHIL